jgi:four helix bundle suffix protein
MCCDKWSSVRTSTDGTYGTHGTYVSVLYEKEAPRIYLAARKLPELLSYKKAKVVYDVTFAFCRSAAKPDPAYDDFREFCETRSAEVVANIAICLIHQTNYLLDQQIRRLERDFVNEGGIRERMARVRLQQRRGGAPRNS